MDTKKLAQNLEEHLPRIRAALSAVAPDELSRPTRNEGWTVGDAVAHIVASEASMVRTSAALKEGLTVYDPSVTLDERNQEAIDARRGNSIEEFIAELENNRRESVAFVKDLSDSDLEIRGRTTSGRENSVGWLLNHITEHQDEHLAEISARDSAGS